MRFIGPTIVSLISFASYGFEAKDVPEGLMEKCKQVKEEKAALLKTQPEKLALECVSTMTQELEGCERDQDLTKDEAEEKVDIGGTKDKTAAIEKLKARQASFLRSRDRNMEYAERCMRARKSVRDACAKDRQAIEDGLVKLGQDFARLENERRAASEDLRTGRDQNAGQRLAEITRQADFNRSEALDFKKGREVLDNVMRAADANLDSLSSCNYGRAIIYDKYAARDQEIIQEISAAGPGIASVDPRPPTETAPTESFADRARRLAEETATNRQVQASALKVAGGVVSNALPAAGLATKAASAGYGGAGEDGSLLHSAVTVGQTAAEYLGSARTALAATGVGTFLYAYFGNMASASRCQSVYYDPVAAYNAGGCSLSTPGGAYAIQSAYTQLASD
ncbi:MAG: hypothetical protein AB7F86_06970 [Bdellovibrionales bacterium]